VGIGTPRGGQAPRDTVGPEYNEGTWNTNRPECGGPVVVSYVLRGPECDGPMGSSRVSKGPEWGHFVLGSMVLRGPK
jgi:hypothetical protein